MRVVAGTAKGRTLLVVPGHGTRPILDRVKTALFDILRPRIPGMTMLDLFAGSGSVGIEALSQGAESCTFTDLAHAAVTTIKKNLAHTGLADQAVVRRVDALKFLNATDQQYDLIYVAPPQYKNLWVDAMRRIADRPTLLRRASTDSEGSEEPGLVIVQIDPKEYVQLDLGELRETRQNRFGNTLLIFYQISGDLAVADESSDDEGEPDDPNVADAFGEVLEDEEPA
ncbi:16S rRNA (guanine(966)-N(2))-methyltransferase RsmD [Singulisphaera acidiphila]|uniref:RNA methyltransferase, RsmD family n=1 Tax=Singulisphaera acidiphila (strain ATCC BAA-1392 / DSM 18658 / VKM B-2454 / MOB10) TaxID=886293 RepID=L0DPS9_SINAD|nr:16S rRNA (guanine(966)-N(2))-methyltransferase RsmD [Singulisphaera acidiphila]AGA31369.1 RNA methyltransferase, RsmD family [Singulisphaera acidiphila DSM 18658]